VKLSILFPVFNERDTVEEILQKVLDFSYQDLEKEIIIIEGHSTDGTREIIQRFANHKNVRVVLEDRPQGKGAAVREGLKYVRGDIVLIQDGDLEYRVEDYPKVLKPIIEGKADIVFGSRALDPRTHWQYRKFKGLERFFGFLVNLGGVLFTQLFNILYGTHLSDGATMFKVYRASLLKGMDLQSKGFGYDWEMQAKLAKKGHKFFEVQIYYKARSRAEGKKIRFWRDGFAVLWAILKFRFID